MTKSGKSKDQILKELNAVKKEYYALKSRFKKEIGIEKQKGKRLLKNIKKIDNLVSKVSIGIYMLRSFPDGSYKLDYVSKRAAMMFDSTPEKLIADFNLVYKAVHPDDLAEFTDLNIYGIKYLYAFNWTGRVIAKGKIQWLHLESSPETLSNGEVLWYGIVEDVTERRRTDELIKQQYKQLQELNDSKDKFFSIIAHDLRGPFQSLLSSSEMLAAEVENLTLEQIMNLSRGLNSSLRNLHRIMENLLQWSMMQRNMLEYNPENLNLAEVAGDIADILNQSASGKKIKLLNKIRRGTVVYADLIMIRSIIQNLLVNALKFTKQGGTITISSAAKGKFIEISVQDSGVGIEKNKIPGLFGLNGTSSTQGTSGEKGTGLGLTLCREFTERNGGKIFVESKPGKGSKFTFTVPKGKR